MTPLVTVFIPAYNAGQYIKETVESVLRQTYGHFELLIVNDGSTDETVQIIEGFQDPRIRLCHNDRNRGLSYTRNRGLELATGEYIAFLDADDLALPHRLQTQVAFLEAHPQYNLVGSWFHTMTDGAVKRQRYHAGQYKIRNAGMVFMPMLTTSTIMIRTSFIREKRLSYSEAYFVAEDHAFLIDCARYTDIVCLSKPVTIYRLGHESVSKKSSQEKVAERRRVISQVQQMAIEAQGIVLTDEQKKAFERLFLDPPCPVTPDEMEQGLEALQEIDRQFYEKGVKGFGEEARRVLFQAIWRMPVSRRQKRKYLGIRFRGEPVASVLFGYWLLWKYSLQGR